jgi:hypothetical protein
VGFIRGICIGGQSGKFFFIRGTKDSEQKSTVEYRSGGSFLRAG